MRPGRFLVSNWLFGLLLVLGGCGWKSQPACLTHFDCRIPNACGFQAFWGDVHLGQMLFSSSGFVAQIPSLGGTCVGCCGVEATVATTGGQWDFSCPRCQFTVRF